jgi:hypothetical protein
MFDSVVGLRVYENYPRRTYGEIQTGEQSVVRIKQGRTEASRYQMQKVNTVQNNIGRGARQSATWRIFRSLSNRQAAKYTKSREEKFKIGF